MRRNPWLPYTRTPPTGCLRLFCFHHAGGSATAFRSWCAEAPTDIEVCPVQLPGREARFGEARFRRMEPLAEATLQGLEDDLAAPFAFFGHSMGARLAFEISRKLSERGKPAPRHLFLSAARGPTVPMPQPLRYQMSTPDLKADLRGLGGVDDEVLAHDELMEVFLPIIRDDIEAVETYRLDAPCTLTTPISVLGGRGDPSITEEDLDAWAVHAGGYFHKSLFDGDHFYLTRRSREILDFVIARLRGQPV